MRLKTLMSLLCLSMSCAAQDNRDIPRTLFGFDMTAPFHQSHVGIRFSHAISGHWSSGASIEMSFTGKDKNGPEKRHDIYCFHMRYWPKECHEGTFISLGLTHTPQENPDILISAGYMIPVWKGIRIDICYDIYVMESCKLNRFDADRLNIGLNYIF